MKTQLSIDIYGILCQTKRKERQERNQYTRRIKTQLSIGVYDGINNLINYIIFSVRDINA
jgi:hypothetical protein